MKAATKRQNFNITPEQEHEITSLKEMLSESTTKDVILMAVRVLGTLSQEYSEGKEILTRDKSGEISRLIIPELMSVRKPKWMYLVERPHAWRRQMYLKGSRLMASNVWHNMLVNNQSKEEAASDWDLPKQAIDEIVSYCESNKRLIEMEALEEKFNLQLSGISGI